MSRTTMAPEQAVHLACERMGSEGHLARAIGVPEATVIAWVTGDQPVPAEQAPWITLQTGVPCEALCPSVPWALVRLGDEAMRVSRAHLAFAEQSPFADEHSRSVFLAVLDMHRK